LIAFIKKGIILIFIIASFFLVEGCSLPLLEPTSTAEIIPSQTSTLTPTKTHTPTLTPLPPVGILLIPESADPGISKEMQSLLSNWIPELGYRFQVRPSINPTDFERDDIRLVVVIPPYPKVKELVHNQPETRFLTYDIQNLEPSSNLSMIGAGGNRLDQQGFIAGYMAVMITDDWRVGVIGSSSSEQTIAAREAFMTGAAFFCGECTPSSPPWYEYPLYFELGDDADQIAWQAAADYMIHYEVKTVYIVPGSGDNSMLQHLATSGINIISGNPPFPGIEDHWVASLQYDLMNAFIEFWPEFIAIDEPQSISAPLQITNINTDLFSPGKQRLVNDMLTDVLEGYINLGLETSITP
jgi:hypothetical protein